MRNEITNTENQNAIELLRTVRETLYPGAKQASVEMVLSYCKATKIDPMLKPVHIVPMSVRNGETGKYDFKDTVMPSIGFYRICAERSGRYAGISEPEFGKDVTENLSGSTVTYPSWCKVTVYKIVEGVKCAFSAKEFWKENYATKNKDSLYPNAMLLKRAYGQLAKCAEAQALRKAFPELVTSQPTFEEMEGKEFHSSMKTVKEEKQYGSKADQLTAALESPIVQETPTQLIERVEEILNENEMIVRMVNRLYDLGANECGVLSSIGVEKIADLDETHIKALTEMGIKLKA